MLHRRNWSWTMFDRHHFEVWIPGITFQTYLFSKLNWIHNLQISSYLNKPAHRFILFLFQLSYCLRPSWSFCTGIVTLWVRWIVIYYYGSPMIWFVHISKTAFKSGTLQLLLLPLPNSTHQSLQYIQPFFYRIPTLPCGKVGDKDGFLFETETQKRASYYHAIDSLGLLTQDGCPLSYDRWLDSTFCLPFRLSHELNTYTPQQADRILQEPAVPHARSRLFLAFKTSTTYVVR